MATEDEKKQETRKEKQEKQEKEKREMILRFKKIMSRERLPTVGVFADNIGVQQSTISHILNARNMPSMDLLTKIYERYPDLRLEWLLYGKGNMSIHDEATNNNGAEDSVFTEPLFTGQRSNNSNAYNPNAYGNSNAGSSTNAHSNSNVHNANANTNVNAEERTIRIEKGGVNPEKQGVNSSGVSGVSEKRKEMMVNSTENAPKETVIQEIRYIEKPSRKITEIRIFFDDNTYEIFKSEK